jgi:hypothetical protein
MPQGALELSSNTRPRQLRSRGAHCRATVFELEFWRPRVFAIAHESNRRGAMFHDHAAYIGVVGVFLLCAAVIYVAAMTRVR